MKVISMRFCGAVAYDASRIAKPRNAAAHLGVDSSHKERCVCLRVAMHRKTGLGAKFGERKREWAEHALVARPSVKSRDARCSDRPRRDWLPA